MSHLKRNKKSTEQNIALKILLLLFAGTILLLCFIPKKILPSSEKRVKFGNESFLEEFPSELQGKSLGLVINHTSVLPQGKPLIQALLDKRHKIQAIFSPEHGFSGTMEGGKEVKDSRLEGIHIFSLYGKTRKPTPEQAQGIDAFIYDIQDVGARFYTYITTLKYVLEAGAEAQIPVYVLDRPNPVGGEIIEGPLMHSEYESFIGALPIPIRYGLTSGELAMMMRGEEWVPETVDLHVIRMKNWKRCFFWEDTGFPWIPTSPNMPTPDTAIIYPGSGLLGAMKLNEGRGTPHPFLQFGAPWLDPSPIINSLNGGAQFGVELEAVNYTPCSVPGKAFHPLYENEICQGIRVHIRQKEKFLSLRFALEIIKAIKDKIPDNLTLYPSYINRVFGSDILNHYLKGRISFEKLIAQMETDEKTFQKKSQKYLLYE